LYTIKDVYTISSTLLGGIILKSQSNDKDVFGINLSRNSTVGGINELDKINDNELIKSEELVSKIPLYNENFNVTKKEENGHLHIEKKWITSKKKIEIPVQHEELFINGKELDSFDEKEVVEILSRIKGKLSEVFINEKTELEKEAKKNSNEGKINIINAKHASHVAKQNILTEKTVPISDSSGRTSTDPYKIELWGEEVIVNKRMVKLGEIHLRKYEVHENRKIDVEVKREKLILKFPGNHKEEIS
jgi:stress response protein YsnF